MITIMQTPWSFPAAALCQAEFAQRVKAAEADRMSDVNTYDIDTCMMRDMNYTCHYIYIYIYTHPCNYDLCIYYTHHICIYIHTLRYAYMYIHR